ncbi:MAG: aspartate kinase [Pyrinomonadaceae bacterium]
MTESRSFCVRFPADMPLPALQDVMVSYGERLAATLLAAVLRSRGTAARYVDARRCIITNEEHGRAPLPERTGEGTRAQLVPLINEAIVPVLGGFIGTTPEGATTTLGRGGSDYSAALVGAALKAREVQIWTDVAGVLTADPRVVPHARTIARLSFAEAAELAYFGARCCTENDSARAGRANSGAHLQFARAGEAGTMVCAETEVRPLTVKAIAHKQGIVVLQITAARMLGAYGFLRAVFEIFERHRTAVDVVATSEVSISLTIDDRTALAAIVGDLRGFGTVAVEDGRAIICVVGEGLRSTPGVAARVFDQLRDINISLISQGASSINLTFVTDETCAPEAVARLHRAFFES